MRTDLDDALATLPPDMRVCVALAYNEGQSHPEIAKLTGLPVGTVKSHIVRGAKRLREILADYGQEATTRKKGTRGAQRSAPPVGR